MHQEGSQHFAFARNGSEFHFHRSGLPGGPRLLLIHGIGMGHSVYERFVDEAAPRADVVCVDLPGFGDSPEPDEALSIPDTAALLAEAMRELGLGPLCVVGHSMGSQIAAELAVCDPDLVERVVLIAPTVNRHERSVAKQAARMVQDAVNNSPAVMAKGLVAYAKAGPRWFAKKLEPTLEHRIEDCAPKIAQPALVLRGAEDPVAPGDWCQEIAEMLQRGELGELPNLGHEALISSGEPVARIVLDWIDDTRPV